MIFDHLDLFRISDFDFRICKFISTWRALRLRGSPCGVLALVETIRLGRAVTPRGESSFTCFRNPKFNRIFQIYSASFSSKFFQRSQAFPLKAGLVRR